MKKDIGSRLGDLSELPEELRKQLMVTSSNNKLGCVVLAAMEELEGIGTFDEILVKVWRDTGIVHKREKIVNLVFRLKAAGKLEKVKGHKGLYKVVKT